MNCLIVLNEKKYAEKCLNEGIFDKNPYQVISILSKYYYHDCKLKNKEIINLLIDYLNKYYPRYQLNESQWLSVVEKLAANAKNQDLHQLSGIKITKPEIETIIDIHNKTLERLAFTMFCLAKLHNSKNANNNGWVNTKTGEIFKMAHIPCTVFEQDVKLNKLYLLGLVEFPKQNDNLNCRITFVKDDEDEELFISDFRELGYEYQKYRGENFIRCAECGILIRNNKNRTKKYCKNCSTYIPQNTKKVVCVDCGNVFEVTSMNNRSKRCFDCQHKKQLEYQRNSMAKKRNVK